jgi:putative transposase
MPFTETCVVDERTRFIEDVHRSLRSFTELCERYGISRKTGYKWLGRWRTEGPPGLENRSTQPRHCPWATSPDVVEAILEVRRSFVDYGSKKICWYLERSRPELDLPSRTTVHNILRRHNLVLSRDTEFYAVGRHPLLRTWSLRLFFFHLLGRGSRKRAA